jgi:acetyltransferase-like isoleucine patch superfamily enzyme
MSGELDALQLIALWEQMRLDLWQWEYSTLEQYEPLVILNKHRIITANSARVDSFVKLEGGLGLAIGPRVHIASFCHVGIGGGMTFLEEGSALGSGTRIISGSNVPGRGRGCSAVDPVAQFDRSYVRLKRNAVVFAGATILPGVTIGENAVVAAGAVVRENVGDFEVWAGVPARKVKTL